MMTRCFFVVLACTPCVVGCGGCGGDAEGPPRHHVSGMVKFQGAPIPHGRVVFDPDPTAAPRGGTQGYADIVNGRYSTRGGMGAIGGPHVARVSGFTGRPGDPGTRPLFNEYSTWCDLPRENTTLDFNVPAEAAATLPLGTEPPP